jgi:hypothetical protein
MNLMNRELLIFKRYQMDVNTLMVGKTWKHVSYNWFLC